MKNATIKLNLFFTLSFVCFSLFSQNWSPLQNGVNTNINGGVRLLFAFEERMFVAGNGNFSSVNNNATSTCLVYWDNIKWREVETDAIETERITAFITFRDTLYAIGRSSVIDQLHLLIYDSNDDKWGNVPNSSIKRNPNGFSPNWPSVFKAIEYKNEMYMVGRFDSVGGVTAKNIAKWNGEKWSNILDSYSNEIKSEQISDIIEQNDNLIICGKIESINNEPYNNVARWNGYEWDNLNDGLITIDSFLDYWTVTQLATYNGNLYAGGYRANTIENESSYYLNKFNGSYWEGVEGFEDDGSEIRSNEIKDLQVFGNRLFVSRGELGHVLFNNGSSTFKLNEVLNERINSFQVFNDELYAGGLFEGDGGPNGVAKLEGLDNEIDSDLKVNVFPNPTEGGFFVNYELSNNSKFIIRIYNQIGRIIFQKSYNDIAGKYLRQFNISNLSKGSYIIHLISKDFEQSSLLILN
jgi:type IX secretion system substrate protein